MVLRRKTPYSEGDLSLGHETILDTCWTGWDGSNTSNLSTATAFVVAGGGVVVAKGQTMFLI
nr:hypothetical protein [Desulfobacterales bacterium]